MTPTINSRGRPPASQVVAFSAPPISMVSQLLRKNKKDIKRKELSEKIERIKDPDKFLLNSNFCLDIIDPDSSNDFESNTVLEDININVATKPYNSLSKDEDQPGDIVTKESYTFTPEKKEVVCQICLLRSTNYQEHRRHLATHKVNGKFSCASCNYTSNLSCNLIKHVRVHRSDKPYLCDKCTFRSNFINSLKAHKRIHSGERPYSCTQCNYYCNSISNLKKHTLHRHTKS